MNKPSNDYAKPYVYPTPEDGSNDKRYPNSIAVLAATILQQLPWNKGKAPFGRYGTQADFRNSMSEQVDEIDYKLRNRYKGSKSHKKDVASDLHDIATFTPANLNYMQLRRMAELVDIPLGLLLLFTNLLSKERRLKKDIFQNKLSVDERNEQLLELVEKMELFAAEARRQIEASGNTGEVFVQSFGHDEFQKGKGKSLRPGVDKEEAYLANLSSFIGLRDACKLRRKQKS